MKITITWFLICLFGFLCSVCMADMIYLKNGRNIEGKIIKEDSQRITIDVGIGKMSLEREDIERIERYGHADQTLLNDKWGKLYYDHPDFVPERLKDILDAFNDLKKARADARRARDDRDTTVKKIDKLNIEIHEINIKLSSISNGLSEADPKKNVNHYNSLVKEHNSLIANIKLIQDETAELKKQLSELEGAVSGYVDKAQAFKAMLIERRSHLSASLSSQEKFFFSEMESSLSMVDDDFTKYEVGYSNTSGGIVVNALLDRSVRANFLVDTGATHTTISSDIARRLGRSPEKDTAYFFATVADGRKAKAYPLILESLRVGGVEMQNVEAAVLEGQESLGVDGLLGMNFLGNFVMEIDSKSNKLILKEFNP
ncbi:MAG: retropepsin-like aspartic protease [Candidatus Omnitrophota bacterium]